MKKLFALIMCLCLTLVTGCSSISREEYDALLAENSKLKSDYENVLIEKNVLAKEKSDLESNLEQKLDGQNDAPSKKDYCFDICTWTLGRPQSSIVNHETSKYSDNVDLETTYYMENSEVTIKMVHSIKESLSPTLAAIHMAAYEKSLDEGIENLMNDGITEFVVIYRYTSGNVIMSSYRYLDKSNSLTTYRIFTNYGKGEIFEKFSEAYYQ